MPFLDVAREIRARTQFVLEGAMFIYVGKRFDATQVGSIVVGVACDQCGCEYFYELTRRGSGGSEAPYGIGAASAARSAQEQAERDLRQRLALEADLVPCPKCNWINDELIRGYRLGQHQWMGTLAAGLSIVGTASCLIAAWVISRGPLPADRDLAIKVLIGGPSIFALYFVGMIALRNWLRSRIQPNRNFPQAPNVPAGSARALLADQNGKLRPADPLNVSEGVDFPWARFQLPPQCCYCLQPADPSYAFKLPLGESAKLEIPRCAGCARRGKRTCLRLFLLTAALGLAVASAGLALLDSLTLRILIWFAMPVHVLLSFFLAAHLTAPVKIVASERPPGIVRLRFRNAAFARIVATHMTASDLAGREDCRPEADRHTRPQ
jgi:hypothetical protein